jgi:hypothetical protein
LFSFENRGNFFILQKVEFNNRDFVKQMLLGCKPFAVTIKNKSYYLEKRKSQRTTGWILFGVGSALTLSGVIWASTQPNPFSTNQTDGSGSAAPYVMMIGGWVSMVASIPFFVSSHKNNLKAIQLSAGPKMEENGELIQMYAGRYQLAISFKLNLK